MKILFLCNKSPWPPNEGGPIAMNALISGLLKAGHQVKIIAVSSNKFPADPKAMPEEFREKASFESVELDLSVKPIAAFFNLFTKDSYHVQRFDSPALKSKINNVLSEETFDIIQLETIYMAPYLDLIRSRSSAPIVLRAHNIEHLIWWRVAESTKNILKKTYLRHLAKTLKHYEMKIINQFHGIATITERDARFFKDHDCNVPITDITFGVEKSRFEDCTQDILPEEGSFFHIGSMDWIPNQEGIKWFLDEVWDNFYKSHPKARFYLAGRNMPEWLINMQKEGVEVLGEVDNAMDFMRSKSIMLVPLLSGSGIRIKIIEGLACSRAVISTPIGAEGIQYTQGKNMLIASTPEEFIHHMHECYSHPDHCIKLGKEGRLLIEEEHNGERIIDRLIKFYQQL